jgi:hypothetical protein
VREFLERVSATETTRELVFWCGKLTQVFTPVEVAEVSRGNADFLGNLHELPGWLAQCRRDLRQREGIQLAFCAPHQGANSLLGKRERPGSLHHVSVSIKRNTKLQCLIANELGTPSATVEEVVVYCLPIAIVDGITD